jgi:hypothetical protein
MSYFLISEYYYSSIIRYRKFSGKQDMLQEAITKPQDFPIMFPLCELSWEARQDRKGYIFWFCMALRKTGSRITSKEL